MSADTAHTPSQPSTSAAAAVAGTSASPPTTAPPQPQPPAAAAAVAAAATEEAAAMASSPHERDTEAKRGTAMKYKQRGNEAFAKGDVRAALAHYHHAVLYLSGLDRDALSTAFRRDNAASDPRSIREGEEEVPSEDKRQLSLIRSNMAACHLKLENPRRALESSDQALALDANNVKAAYRRCVSLRHLGEVHLARDEAYRLSLRHPDEVGLSAELATCEAEIRRRQREGDAKIKGFLSKGGLGT